MAVTPSAPTSTTGFFFPSLDSRFDALRLPGKELDVAQRWECRQGRGKGFVERLDAPRRVGLQKAFTVDEAVSPWHRYSPEW